MWARVVEMSIAAWMILSPYIFRAQQDLWLVQFDTGVALAIITFSSLAFWPPTRLAYLGNLLVACGLLLIGRFSGESPPPAVHQNHIFIGFLLFLFAVVPNMASDPPPIWRQGSHHAPPTRRRDATRSKDPATAPSSGVPSSRKRNSL
jgi:hypothetical protein